jgi:hypothetical protein
MREALALEGTPAEIVEVEVQDIAAAQQICRRAARGMESSRRARGEGEISMSNHRS